QLRVPVPPRHDRTLTRPERRRAPRPERSPDPEPPLLAARCARSHGGPAPARPTMRRLVSLAMAALGVIGIVLALPARPASAHPAHPLGNFSGNQAIRLGLYQDRGARPAGGCL